MGLNYVTDELVSYVSSIWTLLLFHYGYNTYKALHRARVEDISRIKRHLILTIDSERGGQVHDFYLYLVMNCG